MYDAALQFIGVTVAFCAVVTAIFFIVGLTMDYCWRKMNDAVGFYRLHRCWRLVNHMINKKKGGSE